MSEEGENNTMTNRRKNKPLQEEHKIIQQYALDSLNGSEEDSSLLRQNNDDDDDDYFDDDEPEDESCKGKSSSNITQYSFEFRNGNSVYEIAMPSMGSLCDRFREWSQLDRSQVSRIPWIVLTLLVMTEFMRRFDNTTGAFTGNAYLRQQQAQYPAYMQQQAQQVVTTYGNEHTIINTGAGNTNNQQQPQQFQSNSQQVVQQPSQQQQKAQTNLLLPASQATAATPLSPIEILGGEQHEFQPNPQLQSGAIEFGTSFATIPTHLDDNLANVSILPSPTDIPVFWHIPRAAGTTIKTLFGTCMGKVMASEIGVFDGHEEDKTLEIVQRERPYGKFVNVNTETLPGLKRAKFLGLVGSGLPGVISSPHFTEVTDLFTSDNKTNAHRGRMFCIMRHPVDRITSQFHYMTANNGWAGRGDDVPTTIDEYAHNAQYVESNWMVRFLTGKKSGDVNHLDLAMAQELLRKKFLIGMEDELDVSFNRLLRYTGMRVAGGDQQTCVDRVLHNEESRIGRNVHQVLMPDNPTYLLLAEVNNWDMKLYEYAKELFKEQQVLAQE